MCFAGLADVKLHATLFVHRVLGDGEVVVQQVVQDGLVSLVLVVVHCLHLQHLTAQLVLELGVLGLYVQLCVLPVAHGAS